MAFLAFNYAGFVILAEQPGPAYNHRRLCRPNLLFRLGFH